MDGWNVRAWHSDMMYETRTHAGNGRLSPVLETQQEDPAVKYDIKATELGNCLLTGRWWLRWFGIPDHETKVRSADKIDVLLFPQQWNAPVWVAMRNHDTGQMTRWPR